MIISLKKHGISFETNPMIYNGLQLMHIISEFGYESYIAGGAVRDIIMNNDIHDIDIATNMPIIEIKNHFNAYEYGAGERHGTIIVHFNDFDYELTQFRVDGNYSDNRHPDSVTFISSFKDDTNRRDFTINAMGLDCNRNIIDYHNGINDANNHIIRTVGNAEERFTEDPLRIIRALRFAARYDFHIEQKTSYAINKLKNTVTALSIERIQDEFFKTISYGNNVFANFLILLQMYGLNRILIPELKFIDNKTVMKIFHINPIIYDPVILFSVLIINSGLSVNEIHEFCRRLKFTINDEKAIIFIKNNYINYCNLDTIEKQLALKICLDKNFSRLQKVVIVTYKDIANSTKIINYILTFKKILAFQKDINKLIIENGLTGKNIGKMSILVKNWMFSDFDKGILHNIDTINRFIRNNK